MEEIGKIDGNSSNLNKVSLDIKNQIKLFILIVRKLLVIKRDRQHKRKQFKPC